MSFLNRCVCVFFLFLASVGIVSASPVTPTGFFYPVGDDNLQVSGCGRWLTKPAPDGCYPSSGVYHIGVDIMADKGIPVRAIADGEVLEPSISGWSNDGTSDNIALLVRHHSVEEGDVVSLYGHVLRAGAKVKGDSVKAGEIIAYVGHWVGGDHIHFGMLTPGLSYPPASGYGRWSYAKYGVSENGYFDNGFIDPIYFIAHHGAKNSASCAEQRNNLPATITRDHACFAELCPGVALDSRCDPSDTEMYTVCVYEGSSLCAVPSSVWSATGHGASTSGNPEGAGGDSNPPPTTPLPNLQIEEITVHTVPEDGDNTRLTEETSLMNVEESYQVNVWPVSKEEHCQNGNTTGNEDFEVKTDTFYKVAMNEDEGEWTLLKRSETHCKYMDEDNSKKEMISFTVPIEASGKRVYFKSKVDAPGNIFESNEDNNWSNVEWYPVNGSCDLVIASGNLTKGRITLNQGELYGFGGTLLNLGPDSCPSDTRLSYFYMKPGDTSWRYADGDDTPAFKLLPNQTNEEWMTEDTLVADILGTYQGRICADTNNANRETSEVNNCFDFSYTVIAQVWKPDFVVASLWIAEGTTIKSGTRVHPHCIVKNIGNAKPTKDMRLAYYINSNQYRDDDNVEANEMCVGCEQHEQVNNNNIKLGDRGTRSYMCCVDNKGAVDELNESNNCATIYFTVVK